MNKISISSIALVIILVIGQVIVGSSSVINNGNISYAQTTSSSGGSTDAGTVGAGIIIGLIEDELIQEAAQDLLADFKDLLTAVRNTDPSNNALRQLRRRIPDIIKRILESSKRLPSDRCKAQIKINEDKLNKFLSDLETKACTSSGDTSSSRGFDSDINVTTAYRGMCNPLLSNFAECEKKEHGGMGGGGMIDPICFLVMCNEHGKPPTAMDNENMADCIPKDIADTKLHALYGQFQIIADQTLHDDDGDGIPNSCENNVTKKPE